MTDTNTAPSPPPVTKKCAICAEPILAEAKKCIHCGSYQSWHERINFSVTILSLLVALIAVITAAVPPIKTLFVPTIAAFRFSDPSFRPGAVTVMATNVGAQPAILDSAFIMIPQKTGGQPYIFELRSSDAPADQKVGPGETKILTYTFDHKRFNAPKLTREDRNCFMDLYQSEREVSCDEIRYFVEIPKSIGDKRGLLPEAGPEPLEHPAHWSTGDSDGERNPNEDRMNFMLEIVKKWSEGRRGSDGKHRICEPNCKP
jgi:hypothetical protein